jgi:APA family basic amino acid/polyamine antiporter
MLGADQLRRRLGSPVLFGVVHSFVAAAVYFSVGIAAVRAGGWIWVVYLVAAVFFGLTMLSYVEGASMHRERGGATIIARYAFNELWSFVAGWAILLDYLILTALTAMVATDYFGVFWHGFESGLTQFLAATALLAFVAVINIRGIQPGRFERIAYVALADLALQIVLVILGLIFLLRPDVITMPGSFGHAPDLEDLLFAFTLAIVAITGLDASSGFAGQVAVGRRGLRRLVTARMVAMLVPYVGLTMVAASTLTRPGGLLSRPDDVDSPMLGVVAAFRQAWLRDGLSYLVAISAAGVLFIACTTAMLGLSRLGYSLALNRQIPSTVGRLHPRFATPVVILVIGTVLSVGLLVPLDTEFLAGLYAFGASVAFTLVHLSIIVLRRREPDLDRPFRIPFNVRVRGVDVPVPAVLGLVLSLVALASVLTLHPGARIVGPAWMAAGVAIYVYYRRSEGKPVFRRVTVPEKALTRRGSHEAEYGSILVPVLGTPLDDDIMQTAGRLAAEEGRPEEGDKEANIEAMWCFVVPLDLDLDSRIPESELKRARAALNHAKAVGEEYEGVIVNPFTTRDRSAGHAIVREARRRGVEVIVMPAEEPTRIRGGALLGGKQGLRESFVGETTRYVITKAPCRVILTAPPDPTARAARRAELASRPGVPPSSGDPTRPMRRRAADRLRRAGEAAGRTRRHRPAGAWDDPRTGGDDDAKPAAGPPEQAPD